MKFHRTYSTQDDPYAGIAFEPRTSRIVNPDGSVIFEAKDVMVPTGWSQVAVDVLAQKYCRKAGVPKALQPVPEEDVPEWLWRSAADQAALEEIPRDDQFGPERDSRQVFGRLAGCWTYWGWKYGYFDSEATHAPTTTRCARCSRAKSARRTRRSGSTPGCTGRTALPARRKVTGSSIQPTALRKPRPTPTNTRKSRRCYILSIEDDLVNEGGIFDGVLREARIFKGGSGSGANFSRLRGAGEKLTGGGTSSGLMSFLKIFDRAAGAIKIGRHDAPRGQDGRARRRSSRH